jgi:hypothetical protein
MALGSRWAGWGLATVAAAAIAAACGQSSPTGFKPDGGMGANNDGSLVGDDASDDGSNNFGDSGKPGSDASGPGPCDDTCMQAGGTCTNGVCGLNDNTGQLDPGTQTKLQAGGNADPALAWLYPYDKTVFPRGLIPPTLQLGGIAADSAYVHMSCSTLDYKGYFKPPAGPTRIAMSQAMWDAVTHAVGAKDTLVVEVTKMSGGQVSGPVKESWSVAQGSLRGTIYYETYDSQLAGGFGSVGIMQIQPGAKQPVVLKTGCGNVCHTASADGSTLVASTTLTSSASYDLKNNAAVIHAQPDESYTYGGLYPDGSILMSDTHYRTWFPGTPSKLYDAHTGAVIPAPGWDGTITNGGTTAFSPDGKRFAFVHEDKDSGHTIAVMDFAMAQKTFSKLVDVATDPSSFLGWPAFTPDGGWVVYHADSNAQFETDNGAVGDLFIVDVATRTVHRLDALDGYKGSGSATYLPANDPQLSFAPTVLPEAVGGYYWVVFTSHRSYGNSIVTQDNSDEYGKLWVAALDINPTPGKDASHPAFFLDGQETHADNLRGFWVLPPCKQNGQGCKSGDECCGGFCRSYDGGAPTCVPPPGGCSNEYEKCSTAADCCNPAYQCINGRCAQPPPQ